MPLALQERFYDDAALSGHPQAILSNVPGEDFEWF
jgi:hypothetical protein